MEVLMGAGEVSKTSGVSIQTVNRYRKEGKITPAITLGRRFFYDQEALEKVKQIFSANMSQADAGSS